MRQINENCFSCIHYSGEFGKCLICEDCSADECEYYEKNIIVASNINVETCCEREKHKAKMSTGKKIAIIAIIVAVFEFCYGFIYVFDHPILAVAKYTTTSLPIRKLGMGFAFSMIIDKAADELQK